MIIDCVSDIHGAFLELEGGDLLIIAGDLTATDEWIQYYDFCTWLEKLDYNMKVIVAGNHDGVLERQEMLFRYTDVAYLCDSHIMYKGYKIWGSPWTPTYHKWHFMKDRGEEIRAYWDLIPDDIDILVTHGPPHGVLDVARDLPQGCEELAQACLRVKPKVHIFGHIHEGYGIKYWNECICVNASHMDGNYQPVNSPIKLVLPDFTEKTE